MDHAFLLFESLYIQIKILKDLFYGSRGKYMKTLGRYNTFYCFNNMEKLFKNMVTNIPIIKNLM